MYVDENVSVVGERVSCTAHPNIELRDHQIGVVQYMMSRPSRRKSLLVFHQTGTGKTLTAAALARCFLANSESKRVIVVTTASTQSQIETEFRRFNVTDRVRFYTHAGWATPSNRAGGNDMVIIDEAHRYTTRIRGQSGIRSLRAIESVRSADTVILMTATPFMNNLEEAGNLLAMMNRENHAVARERIVAVKKNARLLAALFRGRVSVHERTHHTFPSRSDEDVVLHMSETYYQKYVDVATAALTQEAIDAIPWLDEEKWTADPETLKRLHVFLNGPRRSTSLLNDPETWKINWILRHVRNKKNTKVIVYSTWIDAVLVPLEKKLRETGIKVALFHGDVSARDRARMVRDFNDGAYDVLLFSKCGSEGLDLKGVRSVIIAEPDWNHERIEQAVGRAIRHESHDHLPPEQRHVSVYHLMLVRPLHVRALLSADEILRTLSDKKRESMKHIKRELKRVSIETMTIL